MERCGWCLINELEIKYHDEEWGVPVHDDRKQFEFLMLEVMQCGLSWDIVLKKREIFRRCFHNFDYDVIAAYSEADIDRIMDTEGMIRSRRKIEAVIGNAGRFQEIRREFGSFSDYLWNYSQGKTILYEDHEREGVPAANGLSDRIAKDLKKRGFKYLGSITVYAHLQASGIVNDHWEGCHCYSKLVAQYPTIRLTRDQER